jgi:hypothetical protein
MPPLVNSPIVHAASSIAGKIEFLDPTDIDDGMASPGVVTLPPTDALLGCPSVVLSGSREVLQEHRPGGT